MISEMKNVKKVKIIISAKKFISEQFFKTDFEKYNNC